LVHQLQFLKNQEWQYCGLCCERVIGLPIGVRNAEQGGTEPPSTSWSAGACPTDTGGSFSDRRSHDRLDVDNAHQGERERRCFKIEPADLGLLHLEVHVHRLGRRWTRVVL